MSRATLAYGTTTITLPSMLWIDEHEWTPVASSLEYTLTGALVIQTAVRTTGRPITLTGADDMAWIPRAQAETLRTWAALPDAVLTLTLPDGRAFTVRFRHADTPLQLSPVTGVATYDANEWMVLSRLALMETN